MTSTSPAASPAKVAVNVAASAVPVSRPERNISWPKVTFLGVVLLVFAGYTEIAMGMEWRTVAGRIGPGFFPRILGFTAMAVTVLILAREFMMRPSDKPVDQVEAAEEAAEPDLGRHPVALATFLVAATAFVALFGILGAALAGVLFLGATLWFLDREHHIRGLIIAVTVPILLYLAFETGLNAGLPQGILPIG
ncbi:tripartite tricarboxylate transporter TctB family protein [Mycobacterium sp. 21AC1]|uniref:tripartite tricarboxylate transporter TctB family protein n=1 Tax=[Mycobacterium] appelbergii TaxID=2939269 RepID=UPI002939242C|nr:tripartite tricarboxylate transporter TctB family protein [Mycobacterium sp. 21AC1]MDV3129724.1 tripartite tricarboxylate transporter TctB family protein [Mycobacterium sp. 21AC1]